MEFKINKRTDMYGNKEYFVYLLADTGKIYYSYENIAACLGISPETLIEIAVQCDFKLIENYYNMHTDIKAVEKFVEKPQPFIMMRKLAN